MDAGVHAAEGDGDLSVVLPLAQALTLLAFIGGLLAALWHARLAFKGGSKGAKALAVVWVLAFAVLIVIGGAHHLMSFNQNFEPEAPGMESGRAHKARLCRLKDAR